MLLVTYMPRCHSTRTIYATRGYSQLNINPVSFAARTDYAGNSGTYAPDWRIVDVSDPSQVDAPGFVWPAFPNETGIFYCTSTVKTADITDGVSNTYLLGEKSLSPDFYLNSDADTTTNGGDNNPPYGGMDLDYNRWALSSTTGPFQDQPGYVDYYSFGSAHASGFGMAFCDGSVQQISYSIDPKVHQNLANRKDGVPIDAKSY